MPKILVMNDIDIRNLCFISFSWIEQYSLLDYVVSGHYGIFYLRRLFYCNSTVRWTVVRIYVKSCCWKLLTITTHNIQIYMIRRFPIKIEIIIDLNSKWIIIDWSFFWQAILLHSNVDILQVMENNELITLVSYLISDSTGISACSSCW